MTENEGDKRYWLVTEDSINEYTYPYEGMTREECERALSQCTPFDDGEMAVIVGVRHIPFAGAYALPKDA